MKTAQDIFDRYSASDSDFSMNSPNSSKMRSPRPFQRKPTRGNFQRKRKESSFGSEQFCYISPQRQSKDIPSNNNIRSPLGNSYIFPQQNHSNQNPQFNFINIPNFESKNCIQTAKEKFHSPAQSRVDNKFTPTAPPNPRNNKENQVMEKALKEFKQLNDSYRQKIQDLKTENNKIQKQLNQQIRKTEDLKRQLEKTNRNLENKQFSSKQLKEAKETLQRTLQKEKKNLKLKEDMNTYLQDVIKSLNKTIEELIIKNVKKDKVSKQKAKSSHGIGDPIQVIVDEQRHTINNLLNKIKYYEIEISILKKQKDEMLKEIQSYERVKGQNKKLQAQVDNLARSMDRVSVHSQYSVSFDLSPEKEIH